jgi:hypothetical protein
MDQWDGGWCCGGSWPSWFCGGRSANVAMVALVSNSVDAAAATDPFDTG